MRCLTSLLMLIVVLLGGCAPRPPVPAADGTVPVSFSLSAAGAASVCVAGSFNLWDPAARCLARTGDDGLWTGTVPLPPGRYEYLFVIDGRTWQTDPAALTTDDGLGGRNSVLVVP